MSNAIVLLSGGLDSVVSLALVKNNYDKMLALTFNYGQKSFDCEALASKNIANFYNIEHKIIDLYWLKDISNSSLNSSETVPDIKIADLDNLEVTQKTADKVWVPNRNALFVNIAASFAEASGYETIIIGANKEEGQTFKDNTNEFISAVNNLFNYSVNKEIRLAAPLIEMTKEDIVKAGIENNVPFKYIYSCYVNGNKHCGKCESCLRLKRALEQNNRYDIINTLFDR